MGVHDPAYAASGLPPLPFVGFTVLELVGAPALAVGQARLRR